MRATVDVGAGLVEGTTRITFTPDVATDVIVLRLWANGPRPEANLDVAAVADAASGAPLASTMPDPTTLEIDPGRPLATGDTATVDVRFRLEVTGSVNDRISRSGDTLRLGSAFPLLAWEPGVGWAREPATSGFAEATTSPAADWSLHLDVADGYDVLATGRRGSDGVWRSTGARDAGVSIGRFASVATAVVDGIDVTVGIDAAVDEDAATYLARVERALEDFAGRYGPYPFDTFSLAVTPGLDGGVEYPSHVMQGPGTVGRTTPHEVAHQWFYGLVGNNQGRDPWLDEGLASYAEFAHEGTLDTARRRSLPSDAAGRAGEPMTYWEGRQRSYYRGVYVQPAAVLAALGDLGLVDCALAHYVARNAWRVARPADLLDIVAAVIPGADGVLADAGLRG